MRCTSCTARKQTRSARATATPGCPSLAESRDARLLWFLEQAHGTGPSYTVLTITAVASLEALAKLNERVRRGDLKTWSAEVDRLRYDSIAKVLEPVEWSPLHEIDLEAVPVGDVRDEPDLPLFMEDTAWPHPGRLDDYLARAGTLYIDTLRRAAEHGRNLLELVAAFTTLYGAGRQREVVLWQRVSRPELLGPLLSREVPAAYRAPGTWMHDALELRDRWESRLLRVAPWSPLRLTAGAMRIGVDTGGTFTDVVDDAGRSAKVPSTPDDTAEAVRAGVAEVANGATVELLAHGTTVATNALLERNSAPVALMTTAGLADVIEIARQDRPSLYDTSITRPEPLVPRSWRLDVAERLGGGRVGSPADRSRLATRGA